VLPMTIAQSVFVLPLSAIRIISTLFVLQLDVLFFEVLAAKVIKKDLKPQVYADFFLINLIFYVPLHG
jgi:hypothetical protein